MRKRTLGAVAVIALVGLAASPAVAAEEEAGSTTTTIIAPEVSQTSTTTIPPEVSETSTTTTSTVPASPTMSDTDGDGGAPASTLPFTGAPADAPAFAAVAAVIAGITLVVGARRAPEGHSRV